ncbi:LysR family transcriptional regulator [Pseudooceanicola sp. CBS1P-1]|uniref:LysR family transcriptional regulator n=1 Tax=Pseudooceanicola albus TaxID=2692189 RepID=A0A6L7G465_9RHOB|nr:MULTISPECIES: LysR family transcriptional regulator [Pseudooceanicola]MBT9382965.1 LysR family transcriptional regulator [Pseudooceanicola endophyticus]MXN19154.1 LysR family transcriptional regulator [Pseudooceanicola albus]
MQSIKPIRVFLTVIEQGSFAGAARSLRMTPASVTRIIAQLEQDLGQQLLLRTTRQVSLTGAGAMVAARYRPVVQDFDRVTEEVTRTTRPDRGRLAINAPMSFGMRLMPGLLASFRLAYPHITLDLQLTDRLVDILDERCDLAIRIADPPGDKSTIWRRICEVPRRVVAAPALFERIPRPDQPEELLPEHCLSYDAGGGAETWTFARGGLRRQLRAGAEIVSNNGEFLYEMALSGNGLVNLPEFLLHDGLASGRLEAVLPDWQLPPLTLMLYYPPYDKLPPLVETFTDFFEAYIRDLDSFDFGPGG